MQFRNWISGHKIIKNSFNIFLIFCYFCANTCHKTRSEFHSPDKVSHVKNKSPYVTNILVVVIFYRMEAITGWLSRNNVSPMSLFILLLDDASIFNLLGKNTGQGLNDFCENLAVLRSALAPIDFSVLRSPPWSPGPSGQSPCDTCNRNAESREVGPFHSSPGPSGQSPCDTCNRNAESHETGQNLCDKTRELNDLVYSRFRLAPADGWRRAEYLKQEVIDGYMRVFRGTGLPILYQLGFLKPDGGIKRRHMIFQNWEDGISFCWERMLSRALSDRDRPVMILEVPLPARGVLKMYVDWDLSTALMKGMGVERLRAVAMDLPSELCKIMVDLGILSADDRVRVFFKEGTRMLKDVKGVESSGQHWKVSFHFIFFITGTVEQIKAAWRAIFDHVRAKSPIVHDIIHLPPGELLKKLDPDDLPPMCSLMGIDLAGIRNACQVRAD